MSAADLSRLALLAAIWGASFLFARIGVPAVGAAWFTEARVAITAAALLAYALTLRLDLGWRAHWRHYLVMGVGNAALPWGLYSYAAHHLTAGYLAILNSAVPWFAAVLSALFLDERFTARMLLGLSIGVCGVALLVGLGPLAVTADVALAALASIGATLCYALAGLYILKRARHVPPFGLTTGSMLVASVAVAPFVPGPFPFDALDARVVTSILCISLVCSATAFLMYFRLLVNVGPTRATTVTFLIPVFGVLWGALFLGEPVGAATIGGVTLIVAGSYLVIRRSGASAAIGNGRKSCAGSGG